MIFLENKGVLFLRSSRYSSGAVKFKGKVWNQCKGEAKNWNELMFGCTHDGSMGF